MSDNVLVVAEHADGQLRKINAPVVTFAVKAAEIQGGEVIGLVLGSDVDGVAQQFAKLEGLSKVLVADDDAFAEYLPAEYASAIATIAEDVDATLVATVASFRGKDFIPRVAGKLEAEETAAAVVSDVSGLEDEDGELIYKRPIWSGKLIEVVKPSDDVEITCVTVRVTEFEPAGDGGNAPIESVSAEAEGDGSTFVSFDKVQSERPELTDADVVIAGGRGLKSRENFVMLENLADLFTGAVGASRAAVDSGMAPNDWQIGQTGKIVAPKLYVAVAISGAIQHLAGMKGSKCIVAINKDPEAPIFQVADYGLVADAFKVVPELVEAIKAEM